MSDFAQLPAAERARICERIYRAAGQIGPASYTALMHRCGLSLATVVDAVNAMEKRGALRVVRGTDIPDQISIVPRNKPAQ